MNEKQAARFRVAARKNGMDAEPNWLAKTLEDFDSDFASGMHRSAQVCHVTATRLRNHADHVARELAASIKEKRQPDGMTQALIRQHVSQEIAAYAHEMGYDGNVFAVTVLYQKAEAMDQLAYNIEHVISQGDAPGTTNVFFQMSDVVVLTREGSTLKQTYSERPKVHASFTTLSVEKFAAMFGCDAEELEHALPFPQRARTKVEA